MQSQNLNRDYDPFFNEEKPEIRSAAGGGETVFAYWAVYNKRSRVMTTMKTQKRFVEIIKPGAFDRTDFSDVRSHFDHGAFLCAEPTLRFGLDQRGAWMEYDHDPADPNHVAAYRAIKRGDAKGASFQFPPLPPDCYTLSKEGDLIVRTISRFPRVVEFGSVITPAYRDTTTFIRSLDEADESEIEPSESRDMSGAYNANTNPTEAQKEAGNYKKGKVRVYGMPISIENPKGSVRSGTDKDGKPWQNTMHAHYGYILGSKAIDGDNLDVFLTDDAEAATLVFVVDQIRDGAFDEHKCLIGPASIDDARKLYLSHYPDDWTGLGAICSVPMPCFSAWAMDGKVKRQPLMYGALRLFNQPELKETARKFLEIGGTPAENRGIPAELGGNEVELGGTPVEEQRNAGGKVAEAGGKVKEAGKKVEEAGEKIEEVIEEDSDSAKAEKAAAAAAAALQKVNEAQAEAVDAVNAAKAATAEEVAKKSGIDPKEAVLMQRKLQVRATLI